ncbi:MAG: SDR family NAD(P)-dependent oxidoreductase [Myxococcota bacterium]|nr:SDR family NAD(P)-dependent oxidoreductase [Myxococcota bacterium]
MKDLHEKVAVVTGGGGGIGRGMALAFANSGMRVAVADIDADAAEAVCAELLAMGCEALAVATDVIDRGSVESLAENVYQRFGAAHVLCNNAGVTTFETLEQSSDADWEWVLGVNLHGVVHGLQAFLPRMKAQPGEKHVVNTASAAGMQPYSFLGPYVATKFAVVGISETLRMEGESWGLSASVLCPGNVATEIVQSGRNRHAHLGGDEGPVRQEIVEAIERGLDPELVGRMVRDAVLRNDLHIFTHPEQREEVAARFERILASFDDIEKRGQE